MWYWSVKAPGTAMLAPALAACLGLKPTPYTEQETIDRAKADQVKMYQDQDEQLVAGPITHYEAATCALTSHTEPAPRV